MTDTKGDSMRALLEEFKMSWQRDQEISIDQALLAIEKYIAENYVRKEKE